MSCWFWEASCMIDYPAWVQAVGTVIAIFVAIWIPYWQRNISEKNAKDISDRKRNSQMQVGYYFANQVTKLLENCIEADSLKNKDKLKIQLPKLEDLLIWSRTFVIDTYSKKEMKSFLEIRDAAFELKSWIEIAEYYMSKERCDKSEVIKNKISKSLKIFE